MFDPKFRLAAVYRAHSVNEPRDPEETNLLLDSDPRWFLSWNRTDAMQDSDRIKSTGLVITKCLLGNVQREHDE